MSSLRKIAWCIPVPTQGSGGFRTIFNKADELQKRGYQCDFYIVCLDEGVYIDPESIEQQISNWFGYRPDNVFTSDFLCSEYCACIATAWSTVRFVVRQTCSHKLYFAQDYEPWFYPMEYNYIEAELTYDMGLTPISIGRWLSRAIGERAGKPVPWCDFGANEDIYHAMPNSVREHALCAIYQPEKNRRFPDLLIDCLRLLLSIDLDLTVYLFGSNEDPAYPRYQNRRIHYLGILSPHELNKLYNRCSCGISLSGSNPSRIPFEMMAAGLPTVDLFRVNTQYDFAEKAIVLADPSPAGLASAAYDLLHKKELAKKYSKGALTFMRERSSHCEDSQFANEVEKIIFDKESGAQFSQRQYNIDRYPINSAFKILENKLYSDREKDARISQMPIYGDSFAIRLVPENPDCKGEYRVGVWSEKDQSDLVWGSGHLVDGIAELKVHLTSISTVPRKYTFHFYHFVEERSTLYLGAITQVLCSGRLNKTSQTTRSSRLGCFSCSIRPIILAKE